MDDRHSRQGDKLPQQVHSTGPCSLVDCSEAEITRAKCSIL